MGPSSFRDDKTNTATCVQSEGDVPPIANDSKLSDEQATTPPPAELISFWKCIKTYRYASLLCVAAALGILSDGYQIQMSGSIVALKGFTRTFGEPNEDGKYVINPQYLALWGSLKNVAAMIGAAIGSYPADKFGRRWMIFLVQVIMIGGCVLEQFATHWTHWLGARLLDGFSVGLAQCCINVYISEMAPTAGRGALLSLVMLNYAIGSFLSAVSLNIVTNQPPEQWRHAVLSQFALSGAALAAWAFLPESPRWHCMHGREKECKKILQKVNGNVAGYDLDMEYQRMCWEINNDRATKSCQSNASYLEVFQGTNLRRLFISFLPWHWQSAIGVPIITTYSAYFFDLAGLQNPFIGTVTTRFDAFKRIRVTCSVLMVSSIVAIAMLILAVPLVERLGRRTLMLSFAPVSVGSLIVMGGVLKTSGSAIGPVLVTMACIWQVGYMLSAGAMGYIYVAETPTSRLRAKTTGIAVFFVQGMATVYVYIAPIMLNAPGLGMSNTLFFWAGTGTAIYIAVWFMVPETKGRSFAELDELFERKIPAWKFSKTDTREDIARREAGTTGSV